jgi:phosphatidylethanolamine-binding protein (PEBP) family uncharacterized protein
MHRAPRWLAVLFAVALVPLALAACSSSSTTATTPAGGSSPAGNGAGSTPSAGGFTLTSSAFQDGQPIPAQFTCAGAGESPPLAWTGVPDGTKTLALTVVDPDAPMAGGFTHWARADIDPDTTSLPQASKGYFGPCPPAGPAHHYIFTLYAFGDAPPSTDRAGIEKASDVLGKAMLTGTVQK